MTSNSSRRIGSWLVASAALAATAFGLMLPAAAHAQAVGADPQATQLLKRMTDYVGQLPRFSVDTAATVEAVLITGQKLQFNSTTRATLQRPDKLRSERVGDVLSQLFYYDGRTVTIYNPQDGYYATVPAPATIDAMLDFAREKLDVVAPAGDLLTLDAYERLMDGVTEGFVVGKSAIGGVRCDHLAFRSGDIDWQIWIEDGERPLPRKFVITSLDVERAPQFEVVMSNWSLKPRIPAGFFDFKPPPGARAIEFLPFGQAGEQP
ncbi:MAG: DUF2092 domain-containing protein [Steroidobacteraceae bacterium]|nr:DUF2092 domain-containing protein [Steroidobacteraceae bacterium]